jgi:hypothetical protein
VILKKIKEWLSLNNATEERKKRFKPLRMTVLGCGGTGIPAPQPYSRTTIASLLLHQLEQQHTM